VLIDILVQLHHLEIAMVVEDGTTIDRGGHHHLVVIDGTDHQIDTITEGEVDPDHLMAVIVTGTPIPRTVFLYQEEPPMRCLRCRS
jgi:hypothetical protein